MPLGRFIDLEVAEDILYLFLLKKHSTVGAKASDTENVLGDPSQGTFSVYQKMDHFDVE